MSVNIEERSLNQATPEVDLPSRPRCHQAELAEVNGHGDLYRLGVRNGLEISAYNLTLKDRFHRKVDAQPGLTIVYLLNASGCSYVRSARSNKYDSKLEYEPGKAFACYAKSDFISEYDVPAGSRFIGIEIRASADFLDRLDTRGLFDGIDDRHPLTVAMTQAVWFGQFPITGEANTLTSKILHNAFAGNSDDLTIEAHLLELLAMSISSIRKPLFCDQIKFLHSARKLRNAKTLMLRELDRNWTIGQLARAVGLSEKRLKEDFRNLFGIPVYGYLQRARMQHAKILLANADTTVTAVSLEVGYTNPSRFSQLFQREYGVTPSKFKQGILGDQRMH